MCRRTRFLPSGKSSPSQRCRACPTLSGTQEGTPGRITRTGRTGRYSSPALVLLRSSPEAQKRRLLPPSGCHQALRHCYLCSEVRRYCCDVTPTHPDCTRPAVTLCAFAPVPLRGCGFNCACSVRWRCAPKTQATNSEERRQQCQRAPCDTPGKA